MKYVHKQEDVYNIAPLKNRQTKKHISFPLNRASEHNLSIRIGAPAYVRCYVQIL